MTKKIVKVKTRPWDAAEHLRDEDDMATYLETALEDGDPALVAATLGDIARAKGMSQIARETGLGRESLYRHCRRMATRNFPQCSRLCAPSAFACTQQPMFEPDARYRLDSFRAPNS